jgi:hypothetical protein
MNMARLSFLIRKVLVDLKTVSALRPNMNYLFIYFLLQFTISCNVILK